MKRRGTTVLPALLIAGLLLPPAAVAQSVQDTSCAQLGSGNHVTHGDSRFAQTFTAGMTGKLIATQIRITKNVSDGPGDYVFSLMATTQGPVPLDHNLATTVVPEAAVPGGSINLPTTATFNSPATVTTGYTYALAVTRPGAGSNGLRVNTRAGTGCPGALFHSSAQFGPWTDLGADLIFTNFVDPPAKSKIRKRPQRKSEQDTARFKFSSNEINVTFRCSLDYAKFRKCRSPKTYRQLENGKHFFMVQAIDAVGNFGLRPASFAWWVKTAD